MLDYVEGHVSVVIFNQKDEVVSSGYATPENAPFAARIMAQDYRKAFPYQGVKTKARFYVDGVMVAEVS